MSKLIVHFTAKFESLYNILNELGLRLGFCSEDFRYRETVYSRAAHPMVCFCEFDEGTEIKSSYGKYGVGFTKEWARKNNIGPVLYVSNESAAAKGIGSLLKARRKNDGKYLPRAVKLAIMEIKCFVKNETGRNDKLQQANFDFKAENEWRYVPTKKQIGNYLISQNQRTYLKNKTKHNDKLSKYPLLFKLNDVAIIFVRTKSEKDAIIKGNDIPGEIIRIVS